MDFSLRVLNLQQIQKSVQVKLMTSSQRHHGSTIELHGNHGNHDTLVVTMIYDAFFFVVTNETEVYWDSHYGSDVTVSGDFLDGVSFQPAAAYGPLCVGEAAPC